MSWQDDAAIALFIAVALGVAYMIWRVVHGTIQAGAKGVKAGYKYANDHPEVVTAAINAYGDTAKSAAAAAPYMI